MIEFCKSKDSKLIIRKQKSSCDLCWFFYPLELQSWTKILRQVRTFGTFRHMPDNVENLYLHFLLIFNIVLGGE